MSDNGGLSPIGGLQPIGGGGGLTPVGGGGATPPAPPPSAPPGGAAPPGGLSGVGGLASLNPGAPAAAPPPTAAPMPLTGQPLPGAAPPIPAPGVYTPPGAAARPAAGPVYVDEGGGASKLIPALAGVGALLLLIGLYFLLRPTPSATVPTSYGQFTAADGSFTCDAPEGWKQRASGAASGDEKSVGPNGVFFTSGGAEIEITISSVADLMGAQLMFGNEVVPESMGGSRANGVHKINKKAVAKRVKGYKENDINLPPGLEAMMGGVVFAGLKAMPDLRVSEWTATGNQFGFGGPLHGYRASLAGGDIIASAVCRCSERDWPKLKPVFLRVMTSVRENRQAGGRGGSINVPGAGQIPNPALDAKGFGGGQ